MDFQQSLDYLYGLQKFGIKLGLDNIEALLTRFGRPERSFGVIHVAGTNGKGSVCASLERILREAGFRVGLYTSPHLHSFTERIQVNGEAISELAVARYADEIREATQDIPATFFEFTTAMALLHFQREQVDFAVLEVGMGGRLDATNAVEHPLVSVITSIGLDHMSHLGTTLREIAAEKGGIIKPRGPLIVGRQEPEALGPLLELASQRQAPVRLAGREFAVQPGPDRFAYVGNLLHLTELRPGLVGAHQYDNLSLALAAVEELQRQGVPISAEAIRAGVALVRWPGRLEWWQGKHQVLLDGAHNGAGAKVLAEYLGQRAPAAVRWVVGIKGDKDFRAILEPILPWTKELYCTTPPVEEAVSAEALRAAVAGRCPARVFASCQEALATALAERRGDDIVLVAGSLFLVAAAREFLLFSES